jgi:large subunit ribosomal protein L5
MEKKKENNMREIKIEKLTLNCGTGVEQPRLDKAMKLLQVISGAKPIRTKSKRRIPSLGLRIGLPIGCKVTLRGKKTYDLLKRLLESIGNKLKRRQFNPGSFAFGIKEYIEIPGMTFQREVGIMGLEVCVTLARKGYRIEEKKLKTGKVPLRHKITKEETVDFVKEKFNTQILEKGEK